MAELATIGTPKAEHAFAEYVALGPERSLPKLAARLGKRSGYVRQLEEWSFTYRWQDRLAQAIGEETHERLARVHAVNADTYIKIAGEYNRRISDDGMLHVMKLEGLHGVYDRVKPDTPPPVTPPPSRIEVAVIVRVDGPQ